MSNTVTLRSFAAKSRELSTWARAFFQDVLGMRVVAEPMFLDESPAHGIQAMCRLDERYALGVCGNGSVRLYIWDPDNAGRRVELTPWFTAVMKLTREDAAARIASLILDSRYEKYVANSRTLEEKSA